MTTKNLRIIAYLALALATGGSYALEYKHSNDNRAAIAAAAQHTLTASCVRGNDLRLTLQKLILAGIPQAQQYVKDGTITQAQADRAIASARQSAKRVGPVNCAKIYSKLK